MRKAAVVGVVVFVFVMTACGGGGVDVDWENYSPDVQRRIDRLAGRR